jgi:nanoRNase/pAp phosphatase (c-di-AMP/oligoRNAs hydrolase)
MRTVVAHKGTGGGHRSMAGGQIPLEEQTHQSLSRLGRLVQRRFLRAIGQSPDSCTKLLS